MSELSPTKKHLTDPYVLQLIEALSMQQDEILDLEAEIERLQALANQIRTDWIPANKRLSSEVRSLKLLIGCAIKAAGGEIRLTEEVLRDSAFHEAIHRQVDMVTGDIVYTVVEGQCDHSKDDAYHCPKCWKETEENGG